jgi:hypothetical protein
MLRSLLLPLTALRLILPNDQILETKFQGTQVGRVIVYSANDELLTSREARAWLESMNLVLRKAYATFRALRSANDLLSHCGQIGPELPETTFIFLDAENFGKARPDARAGFNHPANPGALIQSDRWQGRAQLGSIETLMVHEAVHRWCNAPAAENDLERWREEGAADFTAYAAMGSVPQLSLTRYFASPATENLYGGSFLWYLARSETPSGDPAGVLRALASYHLGLRPDLFHGSEHWLQYSPVMQNAPSAYPFGELVPDCGARRDCLPYWITPWGMIQLDPYPKTLPVGAFAWHGPL